MDLLNPSIGLVVWMTISFVILMFLLRKFAWKPILTGIKSREDRIEQALASAKEAEQRMAQLQSDNEKLLIEARKERDQMLKDARDARERMIAEAKGEAKEEAGRMIQQAREAIKNEQARVMTDLRNEVARLSVDIAEKILREKLEEGGKHEAIVQRSLDEIRMN